MSNMFKRKYLKQLQDVQGRIKTCRASIAQSKPPAPDSMAISKEVARWLKMLFLQADPSVSSLIESVGYGFDGNTLDYMSKLGEYFSNFADYCRNEQKYKSELEQLQKEERTLKDKLGIN